jgi:riboflavin transporter FmnP
MQQILILAAGFAATSLMTVFSYLVANWRKSQFREPELLNMLLSRASLTSLKIPKNHIAGWLIHFAIGFLFVLIFDLIWRYSELEVSLLSGAGLGFIAGIIGIIGWNVFFKLNSNPPQIDFKDFYIQLLIAHVIFGVTAATVYLMW